MKKIELFIQGEGLKKTIRVQLPEGATIQELLNVAQDQGIHLGGEGDPTMVFLEDSDESLTRTTTLEEVGIGHRNHVHVNRTHKIDVFVTFNGAEKLHEFSPSTRVAKVHRWATKEFGMSDVDASEHLLQIMGSTERPDEDTHIGTLVTYPSHELRFILVPKIRVEG